MASCYCNNKDAKNCSNNATIMILILVPTLSGRSIKSEKNSKSSKNSE